jgi:hypothetical protein
MLSSRSKSTKKTISTVPQPQAVNDTDPMVSLRKKLKVCDLEVQLYVDALEHENLKMQPLIAKLQAENMTLNNRVKVLLKEKSEREANSFFQVNQNFIDEVQDKHK